MTQKYSFKAVIFDLDGVITKTALVHGSAWKNMFDAYLRRREKDHNEPFREFTQKDDYLPYVDGKPRYEGVRSFLESRGIHIPFGDPSDDPSLETVCGLGNQKNITFNEVLSREGVSVYQSTVDLIHQLRDAGIRVGVASSSKNCEAVLSAAGLMPLIETRVDGVVSAELGLKGKPDPDIFTTAAAYLGVKPADAVVVEDATSGVAAGRAGNFGLVLGIAREENRRELLVNGADIVVDDLSQISMEDINDWFANGITADGWNITYHTFEPAKERTREALTTIGNGYFGTRGAFTEVKANAVNYPGTYIAGLYNRLSTPVAGRDVWNEDFVNAPNWLPVTFSIDNGPWTDINSVKLLDFSRSLHFSNGLLSFVYVIEDENSRKTEIRSERFASMASPHLAALSYSVKPLNYSGLLTLKSGIDGAIINDGVERYKSLNQQHLKPVRQGAEHNKQFVLVQTTESAIDIAVVAEQFIVLEGQRMDALMENEIQPASVFGTAGLSVKQGETLTLIKKVSIFTSKPDDSPNPLAAAKSALNDAPSYELMLEQSALAWGGIWQKIDIRIAGDRFSQKMLRLHLYHLMVSMSPNNASIDASITARGLHGEAYRGHIFWDELFILPLYDLNMPETAWAMLMYRYRRLAKARDYAAEYGFEGAMYPWQSGSDGSEETQVIHLNPLSGQWDPDHSSLQRHVSLAVAFDIWQYLHVTNDVGFMHDCGLEMFLQIGRFWASKCHWNESKKRYDLTRVMGPDEFHEQYPGSAEGGLNNNAYTNLMAAWLFGKAKKIISEMGPGGKALALKLGFDEAELSKWEDISQKLFLEINNDGIIAQYEGYFGLRELDWEFYRKKYGNIYRMDRILKAEGLSPDEFKVAKQADMLMTFYNLDKQEVDGLLQHLGYTLPADYLQRNLEYYFKRTSHGSTLSRIVHARLASLAGDSALSWRLYADALASDFVDVQGGTTAEGIHAGVMAGTVLIALSTFAGISIDKETLHISPNLPEAWQELAFGITFKGIRYEFVISKETLNVRADHAAQLVVNGRQMPLAGSVPADIHYQNQPEK